MKAVFAIVKRLFAGNKISFVITALVVLCATSSGDPVLSNGNYTWLAAVLTPFFFVFYDFTKLMHLGATKRDYFFGCLISYVFLAFCISLVNTVIHLLIDPLYPARTVINMMDVCKWTKNGIIAAGLQLHIFLNTRGSIPLIKFHLITSNMNHRRWKYSYYLIQYVFNKSLYPGRSYIHYLILHSAQQDRPNHAV